MAAERYTYDVHEPLDWARDCLRYNQDVLAVRKGPPLTHELRENAEAGIAWWANVIKQLEGQCCPKCKRDPIEDLL